MRRRESGVTLLELMIAITLVSALSVGMLMAIRTSLLGLQKIDARLQSNRRVTSVERILARQIGGVMPVLGNCPGPVPAFNGGPQTLYLVSSYSLAEGARGAPHILAFQVIPADGGGVRLIVNEYLYADPWSIAEVCAGMQFLPVQANPQSFILADRLASCQFFYRDEIPGAVMASQWLPVWNRVNLPAAVEVRMTPLAPDPSRLPVVSVTVPIHITRDVGVQYYDSQ